MIGRTLSHYEILSLLGEGGMGAVYKARDTLLNRAVAVKVLPAEKVSDPERKRRFLQEAQAASALNHPNIVTIHDIGNESGIDFLVMELVPGKTLADLIPPGGQKTEDALKLAVQIADALSVAHQAGIVHRDLKPGNIMVTPEGRVKVLDFGLAKLTEVVGDGSDEATRTLRPETEQGTILGTIAYMSPEQAEGKKVDARSDIFSFGVILYEMLTGRRPFKGDTKMSLLAAILRAEPQPPAALVTMPRELERIVMRCLRKDLSRRVQHMSDLRVALEDLRDEPALEAPASVTLPAKPKRSWLWPAIAAVSAVAAAGATYSLTRRPVAKPEEWTVRRLTSDAGYTTTPAVSPDGKLVAYASDRAGGGNLDLYVQHIAGGRPIRLTEHPADDLDPAFSPDSSQVAFRSERDGGGIYVVPALGGEARLIARKGKHPAFSPDGKTIAFQLGRELATSEIFLVPRAGGKATRLETGVAWAASPSWSPDGRRILFVGSDVRRGPDAWYTVQATGGESRRLAKHMALSGFDLPKMIWLANGSVLTDGLSGVMWTFGISSDGATAGPFARFTMGSSMDRYPSADAAGGRIAFAGIQVNRDLWRIAIDGNQGKLRGEMQRLTEGPADSTYPTVSRDGKLLAYTSDRSGNWDLYLRDLNSGKERTITSFPEAAGRAQLSPDGAKAAYTPRAGGPVSVVATSGGIPEKVCEDCTSTILGWTPDARHLIQGYGKPITLFLLGVPDGKRSTLLKHPEWDLHRGQISPDGRWMAFNPKVGSARSPIYVTPMRDGVAAGEKEWVAITDGEGNDGSPMWSPDGNLLYFVTSRNSFQDIWAVRLDPQSKRSAGEPFEVLALHNARRPMESAFGKAVTKDGLFWAMQEYKGNIWLAEKRH